MSKKPKFNRDDAMEDFLQEISPAPTPDEETPIHEGNRPGYSQKSVLTVETNKWVKDYLRAIVTRMKVQGSDVPDRMATAIKPGLEFLVYALKAIDLTDIPKDNHHDEIYNRLMARFLPNGDDAGW